MLPFNFSSLKRGMSSVLLCTGMAGFAQTNLVYNYYAPKLNISSSQEVMMFKPASNVSKSNLISTLNTQITNAGGSNSTLSQVGVPFMDNKLISHTNYIQKFGGVPVEDAYVKTHEKNGYIISASVKTEVSYSGPTTPVYTSAQAKAAAFTYLGGKIENTSTAPYNTTKAPKLVIYRNGANLNLAWKIDLHLKLPHKRANVYVNAMTNQVITSEDRIHKCSTATLATRHNGNQSINYNVFDQDPAYHSLNDDCRPGVAGANITTLKQAVVGGAPDIFFALKPTGSAWPATTNFQKSQYSVSYCMGKVYDYYYTKFGRKSFDGNNAPIYAVANYNYDPVDINNDGVIDGYSDANKDNAFWNGSFFAFGDGLDLGSSSVSTGALVSADVIAHEFTHAVTEYSAGLKYKGEAGALNEAWSDIMAADIEAYIEGASVNNYIIGEKVWIGGGLRSMIDPGYGASTIQPKTYGAFAWVPTTGCTPDASNDYCGVHTNSGVANHWFYLLAEGGTGIDGFPVTGITRTKATAIAYRALTTYFTPTTDFQQAKDYTIQAAKDLYGTCSIEAYWTAAAWYAVGVGISPASALSGPTTVCQTQSNVVFSIPDRAGSIYAWTVPSGATIISGAGTNTIVVNFSGIALGAKTISVTETMTSGLCVNPSLSFNVVSTGCNGALSPNAVQFNGASQSIAIASNSKHALNTNTFTYEAIIKRGANITYGTGVEHIFANSGNDGYVELKITKYNGSNDEYITFNSARGWTGTGVNLKDGKCHHIAAVKSTTSLKLYVDGVLRYDVPDTYTYTQKSGNSTTPFYIGAEGTGYNTFNGIIKEVRVWNIARSAAQIQSTINSTLVGNESGLVSYWPLKESSGQIVNDLSSVPVNGYLGFSNTVDGYDPVRVTNTCIGTNRARIAYADQAEEEQGAATLLVYPNPFSDQFTLKTNMPSDVLFDAELVNVLGESVYKFSGIESGKEYTMDAALPAGYYVLKITNGNDVIIQNVIKK